MNSYRPHILFIPEDAANREIINGFLTHAKITDRQTRIESRVRGWGHALDRLVELAATLEAFHGRHLVLVIDFDGHFAERLELFAQRLPPGAHARCFLLGTATQPEDLRTQTRLSYDNLGRALATECASATESLWSHPLLVHNADELRRMAALREILLN